MYSVKGAIDVVSTEMINIEGCMFTAITVELPKTTLLMISSDRGYIMCGALDVALLNTRLANRKILAGRAVGVKTIDELLAAPLESITDEARKCGIEVGMSGEKALLNML